MPNTLSPNGEILARRGAFRARAEAYDGHLRILRRKLSTYQGGYLHAARIEAERTHVQWLLANQALFEAELQHEA